MLFADRGSLHLHMIVWLTGAMSSETLRDAFSSRGEEFRRRFYSFAESASTQCYPPGTLIATEPRHAVCLT
jgi:hypothetical protein